MGMLGDANSWQMINIGNPQQSPMASFRDWSVLE